MDTWFIICLPALIACLGACTDYTPEKVADPRSITVEDAYASIGKGFLALQNEMNGAKMGMITCKVDIKFAIAAQAGQSNDLQAGVSGGPQYVQAKLSNDYSTSAGGNRSNTVEIVWGSIYPTVCQPVDTGGGAASPSQNNNSNPGGAANENKKGINNAGGKNDTAADNNAASARSVTTVRARYVVGMPIAKDPAIELAQAAAAPTAPTNAPCKKGEIPAHDTQGKTICIPAGYVMELMKSLLKTPEMKNEMKSLLKSPDAQNP